MYLLKPKFELPNKTVMNYYLRMLNKDKLILDSINTGTPCLYVLILQTGQLC